MTTLLTDRLTLTPVQASDFTDLCDLFGDIAFSGPIFGRTLGPEEVWFRALRDIGHWSALGYGNWSARLKNGGDLVGTIGVLNYRRDLAPAFDAPELGWGWPRVFRARVWRSRVCRPPWPGATIR